MPKSSILTSTAFGRSALALFALSACGDDMPMMPDAGALVCMQDLSIGPDTAEALMTGTDAMGFLCPEVDEDWYRFEVPAAEPILRIELNIDNARSPVEATYSIASVDTPDMAVATPDGDALEPGADLSDIHCVGAGTYNLVVRDQGTDAEDIRNPYTVRLTTLAEPDTLEPNNTAETATPIGMGMPTSGFVSCIGDEDFYQFDVGARDAVRLTLEAAELGYEPSLTVFDSAGDIVIMRDNPRGGFAETAISFERQLEAGTYTVRIADDDGTAGNPEVPYTLTIGIFEDPDTNEPNDDPDEATDLGSLPCGGGWSDYAINTGGALVTAADNDWFEVDVNCRGGIIEAEAVLDTTGLSDADAWALQQRVQMSVTIVRDVPGDACSEDDDCTVLQTQTCEENIDCAGFLEACQREGLCGGARECLPNNLCGANQTFRAYAQQSVPDPITEPPPPNRAIASAPILSTGNVWIRVADFQSNGGDTRARYTLRVRVRQDPDSYEADNIYTNEPLLTEPVETVPSTYVVHDCTAGDCCGPGTFTTAHVGYDGDRDYFRGMHPCVGMNCMLRLHYEVGAGDVSALIRLTTSRGPWFDALVGSGSSGTIGDVGRPTGEGECIVADADHDETPFDLEIFHFDDEDMEPGWDPDQDIRFCLEVTSNACVEPCIAAGDNCNQR